jgi:hypothetical protein
MNPTSTPPLLPLKWLIGNDPAHLNDAQNALVPYAGTIIHFWALLWIATALFLIAKLAREYVQHRRNTRNKEI